MCANITSEVESVRLERPRRSSARDMPSFGFATRGTFSAALNLLATRAALKRPPPPPPEQRGPWDIKPLDFSPRLYRPQGVHHKRQAPKQERSSLGLGRKHAGDGSVPRKGARSLGDFLAVKGPQFVPPKPWQSERPQRPPFARTFPPICPLQERVIVATHGTIPKDKYKNPRPHDFRQYPDIKELGLPEFVSSGNINQQRPDASTHPAAHHLLDQGVRAGTVRATRALVPSRDEDARSRWDASITRPLPPWEGHLMLPTEPWPPRPASYTRFRRRRSAHSALLERVHDKFSQIWQQERCPAGRKKETDQPSTKTMNVK
ncbi:uncharacterized protein LOC133344466 isoform X2 [Lethenteron reissneri]|uniref:uncharacterized protein LOC133344466 isoform X2 n=1 Tax=Lethenteron reissneri TaxID=7753 RepID=UPI002AB6D429|nr:uncharacterized protein LOC133344466 isoform X2 [Lethenteron reissneri]